jgi:hypothetical protein
MEDKPMSMNSGPIAMDLEAFPDDLTHAEESVGDDDPVENQRELSNSEYDALEEAVMQTARGRTFLREHAKRNRAVASDLVLRAMEDCQSYFKRQEIKEPTDILSAELQNMSDAISHTRRDIAAIKPKEGGNNRIMAATEDLGAIVTSTERATNEILAAAERIQDACEVLRGKDADGQLCDTMEEDITNIFLACSFQDLTGQRTTKVVNALHYLEQRVGAMIQIWGSETLRNAAVDEFSADLEDNHAEAGLLNGPQMDGQGIAQDDIDLMMQDDTELVGADSETEDDDAKDVDPADHTVVADAADLAIVSLQEDRLLDEAAADTTEGIDFEPPATAPSESGVDEQRLEDHSTAAAVTAEVEQDGPDESAPGEEMDNDSIDAMFDS